MEFVLPETISAGNDLYERIKVNVVESASGDYTFECVYRMVRVVGFSGNKVVVVRRWNRLLEVRREDLFEVVKIKGEVKSGSIHKTGSGCGE